MVLFYHILCSFSTVATIVLHLCLGKVASLVDHLADTLLHISPFDNKFRVSGSAPELYAGLGPVVQEDIGAIRENNAAACCAIFLSDGRNNTPGRKILLVQFKNS